MNQNYVLVTGAAGFVGSHLCKELLRRGRKVIALDCFLPNLYSRELKIARWNLLNSPHLIKIEFDLRKDDFSILYDYEIDSVINQAAMPGMVTDWGNFAPYYDSNLSGLNRLLEFVKTLSLNTFYRLQLHPFTESWLLEEDQPLNPTSPYGVSKLAAEKLLLAYNEWFGTPIKILRYFSIFGPNQRPDMAYARIISALKQNMEFTVYGGGEQRRSNTYIDDVIDATLLAEKLAPVRSVLNICGDRTISLNEAIEILERHSGKNFLELMLQLGMAIN